MARLCSLVQEMHGGDKLTKLLQDACRFIMYHRGAIESYPLQLYGSALLFSPTDSVIRKLFQHENPEGITIRPAISGGWSACLQTLEGHSDGVSSVAFSHDSTRLASASDDSTLKIWDASSGACLQTLEGHSSYVRSVAFSHDSTRLASASFDRTVKIWDASSGACLQTLEGHSDMNKTLFNISFDATGSHLHTEIGTVVISGSTISNNATAVAEPQHPQYQHLAISSDNAWITYNSKKVLWLPSEYRPLCLTVLEKLIGIGSGSGRAWLCKVELNET
ncbi:WD40 repeat-like protein [Sporormia fimetaria CBS 119925]|uniref:Mitochondrial division protein 1 n=1 Tax=Sporormia fimetaria CBS 119925 TaxID=1340428 RepID=A0A6A6UWL7_9PLEO|nr:WD40 repeat-like protein [Sporormia fimetaria CBS 119925]